MKKLILATIILFSFSSNAIELPEDMIGIRVSFNKTYQNAELVVSAELDNSKDVDFYNPDFLRTTEMVNVSVVDNKVYFEKDGQSLLVATEYVNLGYDWKSYFKIIDELKIRRISFETHNCNNGGAFGLLSLIMAGRINYSQYVKSTYVVEDLNGQELMSFEGVHWAGGMEGNPFWSDECNNNPGPYNRN